jgi:hypothetical protein
MARMSEIQIRGVVATTHPLDAYGGFQATVDEIESLVESLRSGRFTLGVQHDPRVSLQAQVLDAHTRVDEDGYTLAEVTLEIDEDEWQRHDGENLAGFSVSIRRLFLGNPAETPLVTLSADAQVSDEQIEAAYNEFANRGVPTTAYRLYQFADVPSILVVLTFIGQQISTIPIGLLINYIYDSLKHFSRKSQEPPNLHVKFSPETGRMTDLHIERASDAVLIKALDKLPEIINSNLAYEYSENEESWKQIEP